MVHLWAKSDRYDDLRVYEDAALAIFRRHGGKVLQILRPDAVLCAPDCPDEIHLLQIESQSAWDRFRGDAELAARSDERAACIARTHFRLFPNSIHAMKLFLMQLATLQPDDVPVPAYLVQTDDGRNILIDSGFPAFFAGQNIQIPGGRTVEMAESGFIVERLKTLGVRPDDVDIVLCTHLDADHAGGHSAFPNAEFVVQKAGYEMALRSQHPRFAALRESWHQPHLRYRFVEGDCELLPGIELIETGGHVPFHQSVLLRLPQIGPTLLAIDAIPHSSMTDAQTRVVMPIDMDETQTRQSTRKLAEIIERENVKLTIYGHDAEQWANLKHAPEFYD